MHYKVKIGMETHFELLTKTKIFCACATNFNAQPNTNCCPICLGLPGAMPALNAEVLKLAIKAGQLTNCAISNTVSFDRKNYFYPDLPKGYQVTQHKKPIGKNGYIELSSGKKIRINNVHMEEDTAKIVYNDNKILVDFNRTGIPLLEVVSESDISSAEEAKEYAEKLCNMMKSNNISDCKMHEGSMRCDVNVSVAKIVQNDESAPANTVKLPKVEIKNVNSFKFIDDAINYEISRQIELLKNGEKIEAETRKYNEKLKKTEPMRTKETSSDYRYIAEPDLPKFGISL